MKARIIKRTEVNGGITFVVQQKRLWWWKDVYECIHESDARIKILYFDGSKRIEEVIKL